MNFFLIKSSILWQDEEQIQDLLNEESGEGFFLIAEAQELISTLTALKEEIDLEQKAESEKDDRLQERDDRLRKEEQERNDRLRKEELDRNDRLHQEDEDRQLKARQSDHDAQAQREKNAQNLLSSKSV